MEPGPSLGQLVVPGTHDKKARMSMSNYDNNAGVTALVLDHIPQVENPC